jgi:hypothetical protein
MAENSTNPVNHSMDRRREERMAADLMTDSVSRMSDLAVCGMGIWQKNLEFYAELSHYCGDTFNAVQRAMQNQQKTLTDQANQQRRTA